MAGGLISNPYVGPRTFEETEAHLFFGREQEANALLSLVLSQRLVLFYAQSGAGKSSLVNTRLIPGLRQEGFEILPTGRVGGNLPETVKYVDNIYIFNLLLHLDQNQINPQQLAQTTLNGYLQARYPSLSKADGLLNIPPHILIIDQFEEIVTTNPNHWPKREDFFLQLRRTMQEDPLCWIVLVIREDHIAVLDPYARLLPGQLRTRFSMQPMDYREALEAIEEPATQAGRPFATNVARTLVNNLRQIHLHGQPEPVLGQYVEPVQLQVVCYQLWENLKDKPSNQITYEDLMLLGNVDIALSQFYETILAQAIARTDVTEAELRSWIERNLITEGETRGSVYRGISRTEGLNNEALEILERHFLLQSESRAGGIWYELIHDRIIKPILICNQEWEKTHQTLLAQAAQAWLKSGKSPDRLLNRDQLREAEAEAKKIKTNLSDLEADFLKINGEYLETTRKSWQFNRWSIAIGILGLLTLIIILIQQLTLTQDQLVKARETATIALATLKSFPNPTSTPTPFASPTLTPDPLESYPSPTLTSPFYLTSTPTPAPFLSQLSFPKYADPASPRSSRRFPRHGLVITLLLPALIFGIPGVILEVLILQYEGLRMINFKKISIRTQDGIPVIALISMAARRTLNPLSFVVDLSEVQSYIERNIGQELVQVARAYRTLEEFEKSLQEEIQKNFLRLPIVSDVEKRFGIAITDFYITIEYPTETLMALQKRATEDILKESEI